jgi:iron complex outermembrane recepter protein
LNTHLRHAVTWLWSGVSAAFIVAAHAQSQQQTTHTQSAAAVQSAQAIEPIIVAGERPSSLPSQIPTTIESATRAQIEQTTNAIDAEDALKYFPSLLVRKRYIGDFDHAVLATRASGTGNSARSLVYADGFCFPTCWAMARVSRRAGVLFHLKKLIVWMCSTGHFQRSTPAIPWAQ